jgi:hypothetical protein
MVLWRLDQQPQKEAYREEIRYRSNRNFRNLRMRVSQL